MIHHFRDSEPERLKRKYKHNFMMGSIMRRFGDMVPEPRFGIVLRSVLALLTLVIWALAFGFFRKHFDRPDYVVGAVPYGLLTVVISAPFIALFWWLVPTSSAKRSTADERLIPPADYSDANEAFKLSKLELAANDPRLSDATRRKAASLLSAARQTPGKDCDR